MEEKEALTHELTINGLFLIGSSLFFIGAIYAFVISYQMYTTLR
ncbi:hypothetical protein [Shouchella shacheensis]|nr:hypothetical protein [Shouchella shacheensis]